eukprot:TRINITY_DN8175_c0_g1_i1.p1 TRINITY_DN8175_c0_g1~~TRINITY_DN8175_c0_g1_i1.p1  ORF type:complete len:464 (+),score=100.68 TRINITY_DN8175_c0_g1_i1:370-1761(+)
MKIAVEGCAHGDLENIYATIQRLEAVEGIKVDLLICCGDFQAVRNEGDLEALACPVKYRAMNSFWKYYSGAEVAPYPTLFVGGNHEASNYLWELFYGGWAAPNIYFLGFAGVVKFGGLRIGGLSGIFKGHDYNTGHYERPPYSAGDIRSVYHVRDYEVRKLKEVRQPLDVMMSHDWPRGVHSFGNEGELAQQKPFFKEEMQQDKLGSPPAMQLLQALQPSYWFSAHLHVKFAALVRHKAGTLTKFLALDKCLPRRGFLQVIDFPEITPQSPPQFEYDEEWLAITRAYHPFLPLSRGPAKYPSSPLNLADHLEWVSKRLAERGGPAIPFNFSMTAPAYDPRAKSNGRSAAPGAVRSPQTEAFLALLDLPYLLDSRGGAPAGAAGLGWGSPSPSPARPGAVARPQEGFSFEDSPSNGKEPFANSQLDEDDTVPDDAEEEGVVAGGGADPAEIELDDFGDDEEEGA